MTASPVMPCVLPDAQEGIHKFKDAMSSLLAHPDRRVREIAYTLESMALDHLDELDTLERMGVR